MPERRSRAEVPSFLSHAANWSWRIIVVAVALWLSLQLLARLRLVVIPVVISLVLAVLLGPLVRGMTRVMPRLLATWLAVLGAIAFLTLLSLSLAGPVAAAIDDLRTQWDQIAADVRRWLETGPLDMDSARVDSLFDDIRRSAESLVAGVVDRPSTAARLALEVAGSTLLTIVLTFFFLKDGRAMWSWCLRRVRPERREPVDRAGHAAIRSLRGWLRGAAITGVVDGAVIGLALVVLDVPAALPLAVITFFAAFFPIVGATAAGALATAIALGTTGVGSAIAVAVVVLVVQQVEGDVLMPVVMHKYTSLHPAVVLVALAAGGALGGILGALVAVPLTAAFVAAASAIRAASAEAELRVGAEATNVVVPEDATGVAFS